MDYGQGTIQTWSGVGGIGSNSINFEIITHSAIAACSKNVNKNYRVYREGIIIVKIDTYLQSMNLDVVMSDTGWGK